MTQKITRFIKRFFLIVLALAAVVVLIYHDLVIYGLRQAKGQLHIIWNAKPVEEFLSDPQFPDSLKAKLRLIDDVRRFAIDSLGLKDTKNYRTLYDQKGEEVMWVVMAAKPFKLEPYEWHFPVLGAVPYKGFFKEELALDLKQELEQQGWDVIVRNPGGWSTLGWFTDPILSKMLERGEGDLANLIIHEMSHATIFVKDSVDFNENLATFIGDRGAERFLISRFGTDSREYTEYVGEDKDYLKYVEHMLRGAENLDSLYGQMGEEMSVHEKLRLKETAIQRIVDAMDTLNLQVMRNPARRFRNNLPNNAAFINFRQYQASQDVFFDEWEKQFNRDLKAYIAYLAERYPFL